MITWKKDNALSTISFNIVTEYVSVLKNKDDITLFRVAQVLVYADGLNILSYTKRNSKSESHYKNKATDIDMLIRKCRKNKVYGYKKFQIWEWRRW